MAISQILEKPTYLPHAHLYLDDIKDIAALLAFHSKSNIPNAGPPPPVTFEVGGMSCSTIDDLESIGGTWTEFRTRQPSIYWSTPDLLIVPRQSILFDADHGVFSKIRAVCERREVRWKAVVELLPWWIAFVLAMVPWAAIAAVQGGGKRSLIAAWIASGIFFIIFCLGLFVDSRHTVVDLQYSWKKTRNRREKIAAFLKYAFAAIVGSILTQAGKVLAAKIFH